MRIVIAVDHFHFRTTPRRFQFSWQHRAHSRFRNAQMDTQNLSSIIIETTSLRSFCASARVRSNCLASARNAHAPRTTTPGVRKCIHFHARTYGCTILPAARTRHSRPKSSPPPSPGSRPDGVHRAAPTSPDDGRHPIEIANCRTRRTYYYYY